MKKTSTSRTPATKKAKSGAKDALKVVGALTLARVVENKVVGGFAAPGIQFGLGMILAGTKDMSLVGKTLIGYSVANTVKRLAGKKPGSFLDSALPGNTGEGLFMLKTGMPKLQGGSNGTNGLANAYYQVPAATDFQAALNG